jgi:hypothetical protein
MGGEARAECGHQMRPARARSSRALRVAENDARSGIAEQRRRHEHRHARIVDAKAEAAKIDGEKQDVCSRHRMRAAGSSRKPRNPAAAAKPEDRQLDRSRQIEPVRLPMWLVTKRATA